MNIVLRAPDRLQRNASLGVQFWDVGAGSKTIEGLEVDIFPRARPQLRSRAKANRSGIYIAQGLSGMRTPDFDENLSAQESGLHAASMMARYRVEVRDPAGRFLPTAFDADLPVRSLLRHLAPLASPAPSDVGPLSQMLTQRVPLFSTVDRLVPAHLAVVYAQLREQFSGRIPAWSLVGARVDGMLRGLGMTDERGKVAVFFAYPEPPRGLLEIPRDFRWTVDLRAYYSLATPRPEALPDLKDVLAQLATPRTVLDSLGEPAAPRRLDYRVPLLARTEGLQGTDPCLLLSAA